MTFPPSPSRGAKRSLGELARGLIRPRNREPWPRFVLKMLVVFIAGVVLANLVKARYRIGFDNQLTNRCLPSMVYLYSLAPPSKPLEPGMLVAFRTDARLEPHFKEGTTFIKQVQGISGDTIVVRNGFADVAGRKTLFLSSDVLKKLGTNASALDRSYELLPGELFVAGTHPNSFDSRYWGALQPTQVIGRAWALW